MKRKPEYRKPWKESTVAAPVIDSDVKIGEIFPIKESVVKLISITKCRPLSD